MSKKKMDQDEVNKADVREGEKSESGGKFLSETKSGQIDLEKNEVGDDGGAETGFEKDETEGNKRVSGIDLESGRSAEEEENSDTNSETSVKWYPTSQGLEKYMNSVECDPTLQSTSVSQPNQGHVESEEEDDSDLSVEYDSTLQNTCLSHQNQEHVESEEENDSDVSSVEYDPTLQNIPLSQPNQEHVESEEEDNSDLSLEYDPTIQDASLVDAYTCTFNESEIHGGRNIEDSGAEEEREYLVGDGDVDDPVRFKADVCFLDEDVEEQGEHKEEQKTEQEAEKGNLEQGEHDEEQKTDHQEESETHEEKERAGYKEEMTTPEITAKKPELDSVKTGDNTQSESQGKYTERNQSPVKSASIGESLGTSRNRSQSPVNSADKGKSAVKSAKMNQSGLLAVPSCVPPDCLYNQKGKICTVLDERCIVTEINSARIFVSTKLENTSLGPCGVGFVWKRDKPIPLENLVDGTDVYFDAVVRPGTAKFIVLVVWQETKPKFTTEPYFNSYVAVEEFINVNVKLLSYASDYGVVSSIIHGKEHSVRFPKSVVFINGKNVQSSGEVVQLAKLMPGELFANVCMLVSIDGKGSYQYGWVCSCLWSGSKPQNDKGMSFDPFTLYKAAGKVYTSGKEQFYMHCDAKADLVVGESSASLMYEEYGAHVQIPCVQESVFCGNHLAESVGGKVKAHVRRIVSEDGKETWKTVMIQLPRDSEDMSKALSATSVVKETIAAVCVEKAAVLPKEGKRNDTPATSATERETSTKRDVSPVCATNRDTSSATGATKRETSTAERDRSSTSGTKRETPGTSATKKNTSSTSATKDNKSSHGNAAACTESVAVSSSSSQKRTSRSSKVFKNVHGILYWQKDLKLYVISNRLSSLPPEVVIGKRALFVQNGKVTEPEDKHSQIPVQFDVHLESKTKIHVIAIWKGSKPITTYNKSRTCRYYYDISGVYRGQIRNLLVFDVSLNGQTKTIMVEQTLAIYTHEGQRYFAIPELSRVTLHLKEMDIGNQDKARWQAALVIVERKQNEAGALQKATPLLPAPPLTPQERARSRGRTESKVVSVIDVMESQSGGTHASGINLNVASKLGKNVLSPLRVDGNIEDPRDTKGARSMENVAQKQAVKVFKNCPGILYWDKYCRLFLIFSKLKTLPVDTLTVGKRALLINKGKVIELERGSKEVAVQFDVYYEGRNKMNIVAMWRGMKPESVFNKSKSSRYYFDISGIYRGQTDSLLMFDVTIDDQTRGITTEHTSAIYTSEGYRCTAIPVSSGVSLHLKESMSPDGTSNSPWKALLIVVGAEHSSSNTNSLSSLPVVTAERDLDSTSSKYILPSHAAVKTKRDVDSTSGKYILSSLSSVKVQRDGSSSEVDRNQSLGLSSAETIHLHSRDQASSPIGSPTTLEASPFVCNNVLSATGEYSDWDTHTPQASTRESAIQARLTTHQRLMTITGTSMTASPTSFSENVRTDMQEMVPRSIQTDLSHAQQDSQNVFKNCSGMLYWHDFFKQFMISTRLNNLPAELTVGGRAFLVDNGVILEPERVRTQIPVQFDAYCESRTKLHIVAIWKGRKPVSVFNKSRSSRYYYDVAGIYRGQFSDVMIFDVILDGQTKSISTEHTNAIYTSKGHYVSSIPHSSSVTMHLKENINLGNDSPWVPLLIVTEEEKARTSFVMSSASVVRAGRDKSRHIGAVSGDFCSGAVAKPIMRDKACSPVRSLDILESRPYVTNDSSVSIVAQPYGMAFGTAVRGSTGQIDILSTVGSNSALVPGTSSVEHHARGKRLTVEEHTPLPSSKLYKNCQGTLFYHKNFKLFVIAAEINGVILEVTVGKRAYYVLNAKLMDAEQNSGKIPVRFDAHVEDDSRLQIVAIWVGSKPHVAYNSSVSSRYFYDVHGIFRGRVNNILVFDLTLDNQIRTIMVENIKAIYTARGQRCLAIPASSPVSLHLKESISPGTNPPWVALLIVVEADEGTSISSSVSMLLSGRDISSDMDQSTSILPSISALQTGRDTVRDNRLCLGVAAAVQADTRDQTSTYDSVAKQKSMVFRNSTKGPEKSVKQTVIDEEKESSPSQEVYLIFEGQLNMFPPNAFSYTYKGSMRTVPLPSDIAMDQPLNSNSLVQTFHLVVYHREGDYPVCGWFQKRVRELHIEDSKVLYSHNPAEKLLSLLSQCGELSHYLFEGEHLVMGKTRHRVGEAANRGRVVHAIVENIQPCRIAGNVVSKKVIFLTSNGCLCRTSFNFLTLGQVDNESWVDGSYSSHSTSQQNQSVVLPGVKFTYGEKNKNIPKDPGAKVVSASQDKRGSVGTADINTQDKRSAVRLQDTLSQDKKSGIRLQDTRSQEKKTSVGPDASKPSSIRSEKSGKSSNTTSTAAINNRCMSGDQKWLRRSTLQKILASGDLEELSRKHCAGYPVILGEIKDAVGGDSFFQSPQLPYPLPIRGIPQYHWRKREQVTKSHMLTCRKFEDGDMKYLPLFMWPEGGRCDPYIITARYPFLIDTKNKFLGLKDEVSGSVKCYSYTYDSAFTRTGKKSVRMFLNTLQTDFYAVVEDIGPMHVKGHLLEGEILFLTSSLGLALGCISAMVGNYTFEQNMDEVTDGGELRLEKQRMQVSPTKKKEVQCEVARLLLAYKEMQRQALNCPRGLTYHIVPHLFTSEYKLKRVIQDGTLKPCSAELAIIEWRGKNILAMCCLSSVYYKGTKPSCWGDVDVRHRVNVHAIILPLEQPVMSINGIAVDAMVVLASICGGPWLVTVHECHLHQPVLVQYNEAASAIERRHTHTQPNQEPQKDSSSFESCQNDDGMMSDWCSEGSTVFTVHPEVLKLCGLQRKTASLKYLTDDLVVCVSKQQELIWGNLSSIYISGSRCNCKEDLINIRTLDVVIGHSPAVVLGGKTVHQKFVIGFSECKDEIGSSEGQELPGIHLCDSHNGVLVCDRGQESVMAREAFSDIHTLWDLMEKCYLYLHSTPKDVKAAGVSSTVTNHPIVCSGVGVVREEDLRASVKENMSRIGGSGGAESGRDTKMVVEVKEGEAAVKNQDRGHAAKGEPSIDKDSIVRVMEKEGKTKQEVSAKKLDVVKIPNSKIRPGKNESVPLPVHTSNTETKAPSQSTIKSETRALSVIKSKPEKPVVPESAVHPSTGTKRKIKETPEEFLEGEEEHNITARRVGRVTEVHRVMGRLQLEDGDALYFSREKCFLFGVRLSTVELWHVISIDDKVEYELSQNERGDDVKGVWAGGMVLTDPELLFSAIDAWCVSHLVPETARRILLAEAGWPPPRDDFSATSVDVEVNQKLM